MPASRPAAPSPAAAAPPVTSIRSRLAQVQRGRQKAARRILIYGAGGLGKTTVAAGAPKPIFVDLNQGSLGFDVDRYTFDDSGRTKPESFDELLEAVNDVARAGASTYQTIVLDVLSDVEALIWAHLVAKGRKGEKTIEDVGGGYQKGYTIAVDEWRRLVAALEGAWRAGLHVVLIDHAEVKKEKNAAGADYGQFAPKIHPLASRFLHQWVDYTMFLEVDAVLVPDNVDERKAKKIFAQSDGKRLVHARPAAEWMAKSRPELPDPIELSRTGGWQMLEREIAAAREARVRELRASIEVYLTGLDAADAKRGREALGRAGDDDAKLEQLDNWCASRLTAEKGAA